MRFIILCCLFLLVTIGYSQKYSLSGKVEDLNNGQPLAFVSLVINGSQAMVYSDIDGKFRIQSKEPIKIIRASYVGYETIDVNVEGMTKDLVIKLKPANIEIEGVVILPGINPAHRIILNAIDNKKINDPQRLKSFSYTSYDKIIFSTDVDSILKLDTIGKDTSILHMKEFFRNQDLAIIENVVERKFKAPSLNSENVIATRVSGFKEPIFVFLISQLQSTSFYSDLIEIFDRTYINPVSTGSIYKYFFLLEDTLYGQAPGDTTYVISYRPFKNKNFEGLKGVLYINNNNWAIQNVIAAPAQGQKGFDVKIQQMYERVDGLHWFPVQLNTELVLKFIEMNAGNTLLPTIGSGRSYLRNIQINPEIPKNTFSEVELTVDPMASKRPESFWKLFRQDSLNKREIRTYAFIDSLGKAENFDRMAKSFETMLTGRIPFHFVDIDMTKLFRYNAYEKLYAGLGFWTNDKISRKFKIGGYWGYGFGDFHYKYGGEFDLVLNRKNDVELRLGYKNDIAESGGLQLFGDYKIAAYDRLRNFLITNMHYDESQYMSLSFRIFRYSTWNIGINKSFKNPGFNYQFACNETPEGLATTSFHLTDLFLSFRLAYKEKFLNNSRAKISMGTNWPILYIQLKHGLSGVFDGLMEYNHLDLKLTKTFYIKYLGKSSFTMQAGFIDRPVPYTELFVSPASYRQFTIYAPNSFAAMRMNEFVSDRYAAAFFTHDFGSLLIKTRNFDPHIVFATNVGIGSFSHPEKHRLISLRSMEKGYFESGLLLNKLLNVNFYSLGFGAFYRYGSYAFTEWRENVSLKISMTLPL